ncbi:MAG: DUF1801 domain-containing protein [Flavobacteriia bacterium]|jgi:uncharacterized protein YdhG (YjbR/CyaY superfamily)
MQSKAATVEQYLTELPDERQEAMNSLRQIIVNNLPEGFNETMSYGMITYCVPHSTYPDGYHCDPKQALPFVSVASQKNFIAIYHMGIYAMPELLSWFLEEFPKHSKKKLDMGKSCIRFKKLEDIPFDLIAELMQKITVQDWIECYETNYKK